MNRIKFSEDWDKLAEPRFTTIRSYRASKETYYRSQIGKTLTLWRQTGRSVWNGHKIGQGRLVPAPGKMRVAMWQDGFDHRLQLFAT